MSHVGVCKVCGIEREYAFACRVRSFCSHACAAVVRASTRKAGTERVTISCGQCALPFTMTPGVLAQRRRAGGDPEFCSTTCAGAAKRVPRIDVTCGCCGGEFVRTLVRVGERNFCSHACASSGNATPGSTWSSRGHDVAARRDYFREYLKTHRDRHNARSRAWAAANRTHRTLWRQLRRAAGSLTLDELQEVFELGGGRCAHCHGTDRIEFDHILAVARGGRTEKTNMQLLCRPCNASKGARDRPLLPGASATREIR